MSQTEWLPLLNYSSKHNISLSTLRRRIKAETIPFKLEGGKYYILDENAAPPQEEIKIINSHVPRSRQNYSLAGSGAPMVKEQAPPAPEPTSLVAHSYVEASVLTSANRLVEEIKAAYTKILQEKEEQIAQLKEQVVDLKMLVSILEGQRNPLPDEDETQRTEAAPEPASAERPSEEFFFSDFQSREI